MVLYQHQHMLMGRQTQQPDPQHGPLPQIERLPDDLRNVGFQAGFIAVAHFDIDQARVLDDLHRRAALLSQVRAQAFMARQQGVDTALQRGQIQRTAQTQGAGDVVGGAVRVQLPEEPLAFLGVGQWQRLAAVNRDQRRCEHRLLAQRPHEITQQRLFEQALERHFQRQYLAHAGDHAGGQQRMATQLEEVIVETHLRHVQDLGPDRRDVLLAHADRRHMAFARQRGVNPGQGLAVELAVGGQRQAVEKHHLRGHHVVRQVCTQGGFIGRLRLRLGGHQIRDQAIVIGQHHGLAHTGLFAQTGFDFAQFDTETAHFHLMIDPTDIRHHAIGAVACQIAGAVQALARRTVGVGHKTLGRECRPRVVTARQADAADQQFACRTHRAWRQPGIENEQRGIGHRPPDKRLRGGQAMRRRPDSGFSGAIQVPHRALQIEHALGQVDRQCFTAAQALNAIQQLGPRAFQQHAPAGRSGLQHGGSLIMGHVDDRFGIEGHVLIAEQHRRAHGQRHVKLQGKNVERERRQRQHPRLASDLQSSGHAAGKAAQRLMRHHHALWLAGGAGGVDHVGQVLRRHFDLRVVLGALGAVHRQHLHAVGQRQAPEQWRLGQQHPGTAVVEHERQTVGGELRVQRYIGATGLEDRQQADHHLKRTLDMHGHQHVRAHARRDQAMGQAVGTAVEFTVAQGVAVELHGGRVRLRQRVCLEQRVHAALARVVDLRAVPVFEYLPALRCAEQGQFIQGLGRIAHHRTQQGVPVLGHALHGRGQEQVGGVGQRSPQAIGGLFGFQVEVKLGGVSCPVHRLQVQPGQLQRGGAPVVLVIEHHLEQRVVAEAARRLQRFNQLLERQVLMGLGLQSSLLDLGEQLVEWHLPMQVGLEYLGVDEKADQALGFQAVAVGDRHPDAHLGLPAVAMQQSLERRQQQHEQRHVLTLGECLEFGHQRSVQVNLPTRTAMALHRRARVVQRQFQQRMLAAQRRAPVIELALLLTGGHPVALPLRIVGVLERQRRPLRLALIQRHQLVHHHVHRPAVGDDVMLGDHQHLVLGVDFQQFHPHQRAVAQVEGPLDFLRHGLLERLGVDGLSFDRHGERGVNHLPGTLALLHKGGAQWLVALNQALQGALKGRCIQLTAQVQRNGHVVGGAGGVQLPKEPLAFLGERQGQRLITINGRQSRCRIGLQAGAGQGEGFQRRLFEQRPQRHFQRQFVAHPRDHLGGE
ncbi:hypothetical protein [Pseudomonas sp. 25 E 4]|nr:hypothetical protein [Pseudomonas sp. 25 E 4]